MLTVSKARLVKDITNTKILDQKPTRDGYGQGLIIAGEKDERVVVLCADLTESTRSLGFKQKFPKRFIQLGVAEQSMAAIAAGLAMTDKVPFISSYAAFSPGRNWEQIRTQLALNWTNVKVAGAHAGVSVGPDGATHQAIEDMAIMRVIPRMVVLSPCDMIEARKATIAAAAYDGPVYIRFAREKSPVFTTEKNTIQNRPGGSF
jgi:transketolase